MTDKEAKRFLVFLLILLWVIGILKSLGYRLDSEWLSTYFATFQIR